MATAVKPGGHVIVEGTGMPPLQTLLAEVDKWLRTKLRVIKLDYREVQVGWGGNKDVPGPHLILQKTA
jgi:hypothetical protein